MTSDEHRALGGNIKAPTDVAPFVVNPHRVYLIIEDRGKITERVWICQEV